MSPDRLRQLVAVLTPPDDAAVLDLGCGEGEWLLAALEAHAGAHGVGLDLALPANVHAKADRRGLSDRVRWVEADAAGWSDGAYDVVFCVGAGHAFGGLDETMKAVRSHLRPGGEVVLGESIWERAPSRAAQDALHAAPADFPQLDGLVRSVVGHGFEVVHGHVSTLEEWDDYEWSWTGSLTRWGLQQPSDSADRTQALDVARSHRDAWLQGYRQELGFATLVLVDALEVPAGP